MDGVEIEAFVAGTKASKGLTAAHIAEAASLYDPSKAPAPLVFGHPATDSPALGVVAKARAEGAKLFLTLNNIADSVVEGVRERRILGRSIAFWDPHHPSNPNPGKYSIRHLGLLGGQAPAIANMPALKFSADDTALESEQAPDDALIFEFQAEEPGTGVQRIIETAPKSEEEPPVAEPTVADLQRQLDEEKAARAEDAKTFAAAEKTRREGENTATVKENVAAGRVLPAEETDLATIFNALPVEAMTFSSGPKEPREALAAFLAGLPKRTPVGEGRTSPDTQFDASGGGDGKAKADAALAESNKGLGEAWKGGA